MISKFLGRLLGGASDLQSASAGKVIASERYEGFDIQAAPVNEGRGWRVSGVISRTIDGEQRTHQFVRADTCGDPESAAAMTLRKARQLIEERGADLFD